MAATCVETKYDAVCRIHPAAVNTALQAARPLLLGQTTKWHTLSRGQRAFRVLGTSWSSALGRFKSLSLLVPGVASPAALALDNRIFKQLGERAPLCPVTQDWWTVGDSHAINKLISSDVYSKSFRSMHGRLSELAERGGFASPLTSVKSNRLLASQQCSWKRKCL